MATAVATKTQAPLPAKTPSEVEYERVGAQHRESGDRIGALTFSLKAAEDTLTAATAKYSTACRDLAAGKDADPEAAKREMERASHKIQGMRSLMEEAKVQHEPLSRRHAELSLQVQEEKESAAIEALKQDQIEKWEAANKAEQHYNELRRIDNAARAAFAAAIRQRELRQQRLARGQ